MIIFEKIHNQDSIIYLDNVRWYAVKLCAHTNETESDTMLFFDAQCSVIYPRYIVGISLMYDS